MEAEVMEDHCLFLFPCSACSLIDKSQDHLPRVDTTRSGLGPPIVTTNYENIPQAVYRPILMETSFSAVVFSS